MDLTLSALAGRLQPGLDPDPRPVAAPGDRLAAVLVPLLPGRDGEASILFTQRRKTLSRHAGEISFPGGLPDAADADLATTALRETDEEVAISPSAVRILGALEPVHTHVSGILVVPFVGIVDECPVVHASEDEIEAVFEFTVAELLQREDEQEWEREGMRFATHVWEMDGATIWGATGRMLHTMLRLVREPAP